MECLSFRFNSGSVEKRFGASHVLPTAILAGLLETVTLGLRAIRTVAANRAGGVCGGRILLAQLVIRGGRHHDDDFVCFLLFSLILIVLVVC